MANACYIAEWKGGCDLPEVSKPAFQSWKLERMAWHLHITIPPVECIHFDAFWTISQVFDYTALAQLCVQFSLSTLFLHSVRCRVIVCHWSRRVALTLHNFCGFGRWRWCRAPSCSPNITGCSIEMIFWYSVILCHYIVQQFVGHFPRQSNLIEVDVVIGSLIMDHHRCYERHLQQSW